MDYKERWRIISELGEGGQGKVYRVLDLSKFDTNIFMSLGKAIEGFTASISPKGPAIRFKDFHKIVVEVIRMENPINHGALKELHEYKDARDPELAEARIKEEIETMSKLSHPNLLKILDYDRDSFKWFVSEYHPKGTLVKNKDRFTGNFIEALRAFRPLVEGVSELHKANLVHRDIKPKNVFLDSSNNLVLGDFGLVFSIYEERTRISDMWENVGSRDWMPSWAMGIRIEEIKPTFDVFCLGKLLWALVSNIPILQLWYFDQPQFNLEEMFTNAPYISLASKLFEKCIVQFEKDCLPNATALLEEVDKILNIIDRNADLIDENVERPCKVCGIGNYQLIVNRHDVTQLSNFGINAVSGQSIMIFACNHCGHVQLFSFGNKQSLPAWSG